MRVVGFANAEDSGASFIGWGVYCLVQASDKDCVFWFELSRSEMSEISSKAVAWFPLATKYSYAPSVVSFFVFLPSKKSGFSNITLQNSSNSFSPITLIPSCMALLYLPPSTTGLLSSSSLPVIK